MHFGVVEKTFIGYGVVIVIGALGFIGARYKVYDSRDDVLAARDRIYQAVSKSRQYEEAYPHYTEEARQKFYKELADKKAAAASSSQ